MQHVNKQISILKIGFIVKVLLCPNFLVAIFLSVGFKRQEKRANVFNDFARLVRVFIRRPHLYSNSTKSTSRNLICDHILFC